MPRALPRPALPLAAALVAAALAFGLPAARHRASAQDAPAADGQPSGGLRELAPSWLPGLSWSVNASPLVFSMPKDPRAGETLRRDPTRKTRVRYEVRPSVDVKGTRCHEVLVTSDARPDDEVVLLVRTQDLSVRSLRRRHKPSGTESTVENGRTPFVLLETCAVCPYDLPLFPADERDEERTFSLGEGRKLVQKIALLPDKKTVHVTLTTTWAGKPLVSEQEWEKGSPFWKKAWRTVGGEDEAAAELDPTSWKDATQSPPAPAEPLKKE